MFSKITQPTLKNFPSNYSPYDAKSVICGVVKNPCLSKVMAFSNKRLLFVLMGKEILDGQQCYRMYLSHQRNTTSVLQSIVSKCIQ